MMRGAWEGRGYCFSGGGRGGSEEGSACGCEGSVLDPWGNRELCANEPKLRTCVMLCPSSWLCAWLGSHETPSRKEAEIRLLIRARTAEDKASADG
eukprot:3192130-Rhodomonas_salina.2